MTTVSTSLKNVPTTSSHTFTITATRMMTTTTVKVTPTSYIAEKPILLKRTLGKTQGIP